MTARKSLFLLVLTCACSLLLAGPAAAQDVKQRLFHEAIAAKQAADAKDAVNLAPDTYAKGARAFRAAERKFSEARALDSVQRELDKAIESFRQAELVATLASQKLAALIKARADAQKVDASQYSAREWKRAESLFRSALSANEDGRATMAKRQAGQAIELYRESELTAIKTMYLAETGMLIAQAEKQGAKRYAPLTLAKAKDLLKRAEIELTENRYDTDLPRSLAREAKYEARHAIYLANYLREARQSGRSLESLVLEWESPLQQIAAAADINAEFDEGFDKPVAAVVSHIEEKRSAAHELEQQLADRDSQIFALNDEISRLQEQLGGVASQQAFLQERLLAQEALREKVKQIEQTFDRQEAEVFRDSRDIYIRLVGLSFDSGSADINGSSFRLLTKVEDAIRVFPNARVVIEGHTDSYGADESNLTLSEQRAEAVRQYLLAQMGLPPDQVMAVGYGETRPVANNETPQGRARNRRIDVRIVPEGEPLEQLPAATFSAEESQL